MSLATRCPHCSYTNAQNAPSCGLCGELLGGEHPDGQLLARAPLPRPSARSPLSSRQAQTPVPFGKNAPQADPYTGVEYVDSAPPERVLGIPGWAFWLLIGSPIALLFAAGPFMRQWAWFLGALFHESGHTLAGLAFGLPSFPTISLAGHAATVHGEQSVFMVWLLCAALGYLAWTLRGRPVICGILAVATVLHPVLAFSSSIGTVFLLGGHLGELAFATLCLHRAITGGFTHSRAERGAYSVLGWLLVGSNVALCAGLAWSPAARAWYHSNGSYGLANDYVRLADRWDSTLQDVGEGMLIISCLPVVVAGGISLWGTWRR